MADEDEVVEASELEARHSAADEWTAEERVVVHTTGGPDEAVDAVVVDERAEVDEGAAEERVATGGPAERTAGAAEERRNPIVRALLSDRGARFTSWIVLIVLWQLAGRVSERFPTPVGTVNFLISEFQRPWHTEPWSWWDNTLVSNIYLSLVRAAVGLALVVVIGVVIGWSMGRWWRVQAFFTDGVTVGLALPAYIWALLAIMVFGFGLKAPIFTILVSATPGLIVHVLQGTFAIPRELRDMTHTYGVPFQRQVRNLTLPSMAGQLMAGVRLAILAGWGCVVLVEWFGSNGGVGFQARRWYLSANFDGLMGWAVVIIVIVIVVDRVFLERIDRRVHRWRGAVGGFSAGTSKT